MTLIQYKTLNGSSFRVIIGNEASDHDQDE